MHNNNEEFPILPISFESYRRWMHGTCLQCRENMEPSDDYVLSYYQDVISVINLSKWRMRKCAGNKRKKRWWMEINSQRFHIPNKIMGNTIFMYQWISVVRATQHLFFLFALQFPFEVHCMQLICSSFNIPMLRMHDLLLMDGWFSMPRFDLLMLSNVLNSTTLFMACRSVRWATTLSVCKNSFKVWLRTFTAT